MKKGFSVLLSVLIVLAFLPLTAQHYLAQTRTVFYVDSVNGDNGNDGLSPDSAWKSTDNISYVSGVGPNVSLLFKRSGTYNVSMTFENCAGSKEAPIIISAYGEGNAPVLTTDGHNDIFDLFDCSYIEICDLEITAPNGGGIWIDTINRESVGISIHDLIMHDMQNFKVTSRDNLSYGAANARACLIVKGFPARSRYAVNDLTVQNCEMYDVGNGISVWGSWNEQQDNSATEEEDIDPVYNTGLLIENCYFHDMDAEAVVVGMCDGALITNCRMIDCCQGEGVDENGEILYFTATAWFWGSENSVFSHCEIAGQKNFGDGMTVDFDSHTNNCTYEYIYSHDNMRFIVGNAKSDYGQHNNTVRYCLSVNDNGGRSSMSSSHGEYNFKFYNNTLVNSCRIDMKYLYNSTVVNNIFVLEDGYRMNVDKVKISDGNIFSNNCYYNCITPPLLLKDSLNTLPGFAGENEGDVGAFMLAENSKLIGAGYDINDGITADFFGNEIVSNNIGCYGGAGEKATTKTENVFEKLIRFFRNLFCLIYREIMSLG